MSWRSWNQRTIIVVGSIGFGSSGTYAFLLAGLIRYILDLDEETALGWIGIPSFLVLFIVHIRLLPKELRKAGLID